MHEGCSCNGGTYEDREENHQPQLDIPENFERLRQFVVLVADSRLVDGHMLQQHHLFRLGQEACLHWSIWQEKECNEADDNSDQSKDDEHDLPTRESWVFDLLEAIGHDASDNLAHTEAGIPDTKSRRLLGFGVPLSTNEDEARCDGSFKDTQEYPRCQQSDIVVRSCSAGSRDSPQNHVRSKPFRDRDTLKDYR